MSTQIRWRLARGTLTLVWWSRLAELAKQSHKCVRKMTIVHYTHTCACINGCMYAYSHHGHAVAIFFFQMMYLSRDVCPHVPSGFYWKTENLVARKVRPKGHRPGDGNAPAWQCVWHQARVVDFDIHDQMGKGTITRPICGISRNTAIPVHET